MSNPNRLDQICNIRFLSFKDIGRTALPRQSSVCIDLRSNCMESMTWACSLRETATPVPRQPTQHRTLFQTPIDRFRGRSEARALYRIQNRTKESFKTEKL